MLRALVTGLELSSPASFSVPFASAFLARPVTHFPSLHPGSHAFGFLVYTRSMPSPFPWPLVRERGTGVTIQSDLEGILNQ